MSISRCLAKFMDAVIGIPRTDWAAVLADLPETCPHGCGATVGAAMTPAGCRAYCRDYAAMLYRMAT